MCKGATGNVANLQQDGKSFAVKSSKSSVWESSYNPTDPNARKLPTKGEIKASIPPECFERSALHSFYFILRDSAMAAALVYATLKVGLKTDIPERLISKESLIWFAGWNFYAFWQGCILTGHWVIGHECGHGAFSSSQFLNDVVGFVIHHALLVPYFGWQYTHAKHHRRTNHLTDGESHVPSVKEEQGLGSNMERESKYAALHEAMGDGAFAAFQVWTHLAIGWPLYLLGLASTGRMTAEGKENTDSIMDHFRPWSKMFPGKIRGKILLSTLTFSASMVLLFKLSMDYGFLTVFLWYGAPYMWTNAWLVLYTWLQHTDPSVPQYGEEEWTWVRGALSTIDRPYGIFDFFHHKIGSTHVAHHLFHEMPFYRADEATAALKEFLGPLYNYDPTPFYIAMWRIAKTCHYVDSTKGIQYYKSLEDVPLTKKATKQA